MKRCLFVLIIFFSLSVDAIECNVSVVDDCTVSANTNLSPTTIAPIGINDVAGNGVIIINANNIVLDCNGYGIRGNNLGIGIYISGFDNVTIKGCRIMNYTHAITLHNSDNATLINNLLCPETNSSFKVINSYNYSGSNNTCEAKTLTDPKFGCSAACFAYAPPWSNLCPALPTYIGCNCIDNDNDSYYVCTCPNATAGVFYPDYYCPVKWPDCNDNNANLHKWVSHTCMSENCTPVIFNGNISNKIDVVFIGSGFPNLASFKQVILEIIDYNGTINGLMSVEPFTSNKTKFNFWMVNTLQNYTNTNFRSSSTAIMQSHCSFGDEKILLLITPRIRSNADVWGYYDWSATQWVWTDSGGHGEYITVGNQFLTNTGWPLQADYSETGAPYSTPVTIANNKDMVKMIAIHEFGHSFGGLFDEYVAYNCNSNTTCSPRAANPPGVANCALTPCNKWSNITNYCSIQCGYADWYRSTFNSIMRSIPTNPPANFNTVSQNELRRDMANYITGTSNLSMGVPSPIPQSSYILSLTYNNGAFTAGNLSINPLPAPDRLNQPSTGYTILISSNNTLYSFKIGVLAASGCPLPEWFDEDGNQIYFPKGEVNILEPFETRLIFPYFDNTKEINMYDPDGNLVFSVCMNDADGDSVCDENDNCLNTYNPEQADCNSNGIGDACDVINPNAEELCDAKDNNCDGQTDETICGEETDMDCDKINDCIADKCLGTTIPEGVPTEKLVPNSYAEIDNDLIFETNVKNNIVDSKYSLQDTYGCTCEQILKCKPGETKGEYKHGCSEGTISVWIKQQGWAKSCS